MLPHVLLAFDWRHASERMETMRYLQRLVLASQGLELARIHTGHIFSMLWSIERLRVR
jgi:hypothetical protein